MTRKTRIRDDEHTFECRHCHKWFRTAQGRNGHRISCERKVERRIAHHIENEWQAEIDAADERERTARLMNRSPRGELYNR